MKDILNAITNYGFPCVMCLICAYYVKYQNDTVVKAVDALTEVITELKQKLEDKVND